eukprot:Colp12_sorted_trinity150504_noHs@27854
MPQLLINCLSLTFPSKISKCPTLLYLSKKGCCIKLWEIREWPVLNDQWRCSLSGALALGGLLKVVEIDEVSAGLGRGAGLDGGGGAAALALLLATEERLGEEPATNDNEGNKAEDEEEELGIEKTDLRLVDLNSVVESSNAVGSLSCAVVHFNGETEGTGVESTAGTEGILKGLLDTGLDNSVVGAGSEVLEEVTVVLGVAEGGLDGVDHDFLLADVLETNQSLNNGTSFELAIREVVEKDRGGDVGGSIRLLTLGEFSDFDVGLFSGINLIVLLGANSRDEARREEKDQEEPRKAAEDASHFVLGWMRDG